MEADRLRPGRLPEDVVLKDAHAAVAGELCCEPPRPLGEHLRGDDVVGLPRVAELARAVLGVAPRHPVHLVRPDPGLVLALEEPEVALAQELERALGDEAFLDDQEPSRWNASIIFFRYERLLHSRSQRSRERRPRRREVARYQSRCEPARWRTPASRRSMPSVPTGGMGYSQHTSTRESTRPDPS